MQAHQFLFARQQRLALAQPSGHNGVTGHNGSAQWGQVLQ
jgi:hypothetical protein